MQTSPTPGRGKFEDHRGSAGAFGTLAMGIGSSMVVFVLSLFFIHDFIKGSSGSADLTQHEAAGDVGLMQETPAEASEVQFVTFVLDTAQAQWTQILSRTTGQPWHNVTLVLFREATPTACGVSQTTTGPFYCARDNRVYIDLSFYDELRDRFGAPADFAQAYVIAHELGHHVQHLLGTDTKVHRLQHEHPEQADALSVALELQADCYAGVWGYYMQQDQLFESDDVDEGLNAAAAVGADRMLKVGPDHANTDTFTHGLSTQRATWFRRGLYSGDPTQCGMP